MNSVIKFLLFSFLVSGGIFAKTLVISDIDDTIKNSFVLDKSEMIENAFKVNIPFKGMSSLYQVIKSDNKDVELVYLSNALKIISGKAHQKFLETNKFPAGQLILRSNIQDKRHKYNSIMKLIEKLSPSKIILIGDNGENDSQVYDEVNKFLIKSGTSIEVITYIHTVYNPDSVSHPGKSITASQVPFVTAIDLAQELLNLKLIQLDHFQIFSSFYSSNLRLEKSEIHGNFILPSWVRCKEFKKKSQTLNNSGLIHPILFDYYSLLNQRCDLGN